MVSLLFKEGFPKTSCLGHSRPNSIAQFHRNKGRLFKNPKFKCEYDRVLQEYVKLNHLCPIHNDNEFQSSPHYCLPHHAVIKPESTTTKVRVVFNSSSPNGIS